MKYYENLSLKNINGEEWKSIKGFFGIYEVSNFGRIKRTRATTHPTHILKQNVIRGYCNVCLCKSNIKSTHRVHRLMAFAFLPVIKDKPYINHKDGVRDNNILSNIEWCNNSENQKHSFEKLGRVHHRPMLGKTGALCKNSRPVIQLDMDGKFIKKWVGQSEAARALGLYQTNIYHTCEGNHKSCGGFKWKRA